jgi:hypothetical protein
MTDTDYATDSAGDNGSDTDETITPEECEQAIALINKLRSEAQQTRYAKTSRTIQLTDMFARVMRMIGKNLESIIDGGADTMILGTGWKFTKIYSTRTIHVIGFDETKTKRGCRIGTACTVMHDVNGKPYLMVANEAIKNEGSYTSLLSETQMRANGLIVDSTSENHMGIDEKPGTQSFYSADKDIQFRMQQKSGLMTIPHREPTDDEINTLPKFVLTSDDIWNPGDLQDEDMTTAPFMDDTFIATALHVMQEEDMKTTAATENTFVATALHAYKDDDTSTINTDFHEDRTEIKIVIPDTIKDLDQHFQNIDSNGLIKFENFDKILSITGLDNVESNDILLTGATENNEAQIEPTIQLEETPYCPLQQPRNSLPPYKQASKILEQYRIENDKMAMALSSSETWIIIILIFFYRRGTVFENHYQNDKILFKYSVIL